MWLSNDYLITRIFARIFGASQLGPRKLTITNSSLQWGCSTQWWGSPHQPRECRLYRLHHLPGQAKNHWSRLKHEQSAALALHPNNKPGEGFSDLSVTRFLSNVPKFECLDSEKKSSPPWLMINIPSGGKPRQRFEGSFKKCRFRHSETTDSCPKIGPKFPGILKCF